MDDCMMRPFTPTDQDGLMREVSRLRFQCETLHEDLLISKAYAHELDRALKVAEAERRGLLVRIEELKCGGKPPTTRQYGRWIEHYDPATGQKFGCSACSMSAQHKENFCPNCGVAMILQRFDQEG